MTHDDLARLLFGTDSHLESVADATPSLLALLADESHPSGSGEPGAQHAADLEPPVPGIAEFDGSGQIRHSNQAWQAFSEALGAQDPRGAVNQAPRPESDLHELLEALRQYHPAPDRINGRCVTLNVGDQAFRVRACRATGARAFVAVTNLTHRKARELARVRGEARFRDYASASSDWFWETDRAHRFSYFSDKAEVFLLSGTRGVLGNTLWEVEGSFEPSCSWNEHRATLEAHRPFRDFEYWQRDDKGRVQLIRSSGKPFYDGEGVFLGYRGVALDATDEFEKSQVQKQLYRAIDNIPEGVALFDEHDRLVFSNTAWREDVHGSIPTSPQPGLRFEELIREAARTGSSQIADMEAWLAHRLRAHGTASRPYEIATNLKTFQVRELPTAERGTLQIVSDVTAQKSNEAELRQSRERFEQIAEATTDWIWETDANLDLVLCSDGLDAVLGLAPGTLHGRRLDELWSRPGATVTGRDELQCAMERKQPFRDQRLDLVRPGHDDRLLEFSGVPFYSASGDFAGYRGTARDSTEAILAREKGRRFAFAIESMTDGYLLLDAQDRLVMWNETYRRQLHPEVSAILIPGLTFEALQIAIRDHGDCRSPTFVSAHSKSGEGAGVDWLDHRRELHEHPGSSFEIQRGNGHWYSIEEKHTPDGEILIVSRDVTQSRSQAQALRDSEARFKEFAETATDWYWETDSEHRFVFFSESFYEKSGLDPTRYLGRSRLEYFHSLDTDSPKVREHLEHLRAQRPFRDFQNSVTDMEGTRRWLRASGRPFFDERGNFAGYRGCTSDVTFEVNARELEQRLFDAIENMSDAYAFFDEQDRLVLWNSTWQDSMNEQSRALLASGLTFEALCRSIDRVRFDAGLQHRPGEWFEWRMAAHRNRNESLEIQTTTGDWLRIHERESPAGGILLISNNITELKQREVALQQSEARFRDYASAATDWFWETDREHRLRHIGQRFSDITGIPLSRNLGRRRDEAAPDGTDAEIWKAHLDTLARREPFRNFEYSMVDDLDKRHHFRVSGKPFFDTSGAFAGYRGSAVDFTHEVEARRVEARFIDAIENVSDAYALFDSDDRLVICNSFYRHKVLGPISEHVVPGVSFETLLTLMSNREATTTDGPARAERMAQRLRQHRDPRASFLLELDAGQWFHIRERRTPDGGILLLATDVTELKQREQELATSESRFKDFAETAADWFWETDAKLAITFVSSRFTELTGLPFRELEGKRLESIADPDDSTRAGVEALQSCFERELAFEDVEFQARCAERFEIVIHSLSGRPLTGPDGGLIGYRGTGRDVTQARRMARQLAHQARHDSLTGLINRSEFERLVQSALDRSHEDDAQHAMCYVDLDQFKVVNDTCGHAAGDEMLRQLSDRLRGNLRKTDTLARLGGDEFGVLLENCTLEQARAVANNLRRNVEAYTFAWDNKSFRAGASVGLVALNRQCSTVAEALRAADTACYLAKDGGRNRVHVYRDDDAELTKREGEMNWVSRLNDALAANRFELFVQPIHHVRASAPTLPPDPLATFDAARGAGVGHSDAHYEILIRLRNPDGSMTLPGAFLPAAERFHLATRIDRWVVEAMFRWLISHSDGVPPGHRFLINLSGQSLGDGRFLDMLLELLSDARIQPGSLGFEVTETAAIANLGAAQKFMEDVRARGCHIALDDFGSGLSSFGYLRTLPADYLKIDGSLVKNIDSDSVQLTMVRSITEIGHSMGKKIIAEWVETPSVLEKLHEIGVDYAQGFLFGQSFALDSLARLTSVVPAARESDQEKAPTRPVTH